MKKHYSKHISPFEKARFNSGMLVMKEMAEYLWNCTNRIEYNEALLGEWKFEKMSLNGWLSKVFNRD